MHEPTSPIRWDGTGGSNVVYAVGRPTAYLKAGLVVVSRTNEKVSVGSSVGGRGDYSTAIPVASKVS